jgi:hypothetical protein
MSLLEQHIEDMSKEIARLNIKIIKAVNVLANHANCKYYMTRNDWDEYKCKHNCPDCIKAWLLSDDND